jgi:4'-phosphopantetheinyl transferase
MGRALTTIPAGHAGVWWAATDTLQEHQLALLSADERARRDRLRRAEDQQRYSVGAVLTRSVLGQLLGADPRALRFERECGRCPDKSHGKPRLVDPPARWQFSISHAHHRVALAVCADAQVGVDVAWLGAITDPVALARVVRCPWESRPSRSRLGTAHVLRTWVRKEAIVKATGDGLNIPLSDLSVSDPWCRPALLHWAGRPGLSSQFTLHDLDADGGYLASLAVARPDVHVLEFDDAVFGPTPTMRSPIAGGAGEQEEQCS